MDNLTSIQIKIKDALEEYENLKNVDKHLRETNEDLNKAYLELKLLEKHLEKELDDVRGLEGWNIRSIFHKTLGDREKQMEKERKEYLEATLKYKEFEKEVALMEFEKEILSKKVQELPELEAELEQLKTEREQEILHNPDYILKAELESLLQKLDTVISKNKMIQNTIDSGEKAAKLLSVIKGHLNKATKWGDWDVISDNMGGNIMKHQAVDKAVHYLPKAQQQINDFTRRLQDFGKESFSVKLTKIHINKFTDFFFDNLISDWIIQQKIKASLRNITNALDQVRKILAELNEEMELNALKREELESEKDILLLH